MVPRIAIIGRAKNAIGCSPEKDGTARRAGERIDRTKIYCGIKKCPVRLIVSKPPRYSVIVCDGKNIASRIRFQFMHVERMQSCIARKPFITFVRALENATCFCADKKAAVRIDADRRDRSSRRAVRRDPMDLSICYTGKNKQKT